MLCAVQDFPVVCVEGVHSVCFSPILFLFMHTKAKVDPCSDELNSLCVNIYKETSIALYLFIYFPFYITAASWICYFICFDYVCLILWMFYEPVFRTAKSLFLKKKKEIHNRPHSLAVWCALPAASLSVLSMSHCDIWHPTQSRPICAHIIH